MGEANFYYFTCLKFINDRQLPQSRNMTNLSKRFRKLPKLHCNEDGPSSLGHKEFLRGVRFKVITRLSDSHSRSPRLSCGEEDGVYNIKGDLTIRFKCARFIYTNPEGDHDSSTRRELINLLLPISRCSPGFSNSSRTSPKPSRSDHEGQSSPIRRLVPAKNAIPRSRSSCEAVTLPHLLSENTVVPFEDGTAHDSVRRRCSKSAVPRNKSALVLDCPRSSAPDPDPISASFEEFFSPSKFLSSNEAIIRDDRSLSLDRGFRSCAATSAKAKVVPRVPLIESSVGDEGIARSTASVEFSSTKAESPEVIAVPTLGIAGMKRLSNGQLKTGRKENERQEFITLAPSTSTPSAKRSDGTKRRVDIDRSGRTTSSERSASLPRTSRSLNLDGFNRASKATSSSVTTKSTPGVSPIDSRRSRSPTKSTSSYALSSMSAMPKLKNSAFAASAHVSRQRVGEKPFFRAVSLIPPKESKSKSENSVATSSQFRMPPSPTVVFTPPGSSSNREFPLSKDLKISSSTASSGFQTPPTPASDTSSSPSQGSSNRPVHTKRASTPKGGDDGEKVRGQKPPRLSFTLSPVSTDKGCQRSGARSAMPGIRRHL